MIDTFYNTGLRTSIGAFAHVETFTILVKCHLFKTVDYKMLSQQYLKEHETN